MRDLRNALYVFAAATLALYVVVAAIAVTGYLDSRAKQREIRTVAAQTRASLCTLRADLERRVRQSQQFLREHPEGIAGISAETIKQGIANQQSTIGALENLNCPGRGV